jgi:hypothetical protein
MACGLFVYDISEVGPPEHLTLQINHSRITHLGFPVKNCIHGALDLTGGFLAHVT